MRAQGDLSGAKEAWTTFAVGVGVDALGNAQRGAFRGVLVLSSINIPLHHRSDRQIARMIQRLLKNAMR